MKAFIKSNGGVLATMTTIVTIVSTIIGVGFWITGSMADLQVEQAEKFQIQQEKSDQKFYSMLEKINAVDKSSMIRDKRLELTVAKLEK